MKKNIAFALALFSLTSYLSASDRSSVELLASRVVSADTIRALAVVAFVAICEEVLKTSKNVEAESLWCVVCGTNEVRAFVKLACMHSCHRDCLSHKVVGCPGCNPSLLDINANCSN